MNELFTDRARKVLNLAGLEAQRFNHESRNVDHLIIALMDANDGICELMIEQLNIDPLFIRAEIEKLIVPNPSKYVELKIGLSPEYKSVIDSAVDEALALDHQVFEPEHLLLGILREGKSQAAQLLEEHGVTLEKTRQVIRELFRN